MENKTTIIVATTARWLLSGILMWAGIVKAVGMDDFRNSVDSFGLVPYWATSVVAITLPWIEIVLSVIIMTRSRWWQASMQAWSILLVSFMLLLAYAAFRGLDVDCGCFGRGSSGPMWGIIKDLCLLIGIVVVYKLDARTAMLRQEPHGAGLLEYSLVYGVVMSFVVFSISTNDTHRATKADALSVVVAEQRVGANDLAKAERIKHDRNRQDVLRRLELDEANDERLQTGLESLLGNGELSSDSCAYLIGLVADKAHSPLTRNLAVEVLLRQRRAVDGLWEALFAAIRDPGESVRWRDYAIQWISHAALGRPDVQPTVDMLLESARSGVAPIAGTAVMSLRQLERDGRWTWDADANAVVSHLLNGKNIPSESKMVALQMVELNDLKEHLSCVRVYAANEQDRHLQRAALRALGRIGEKEDWDVLQRGMASGDVLVVAAARSSFEIYEHRMSQKQSDGNSQTTTNNDR